MVLIYNTHYVYRVVVPFQYVIITPFTRLSFLFNMHYSVPTKSCRSFQYALFSSYQELSFLLVCIIQFLPRVVVPFSRYYSVSTKSCRSFQYALFSFYQELSSFQYALFSSYQELSFLLVGIIQFLLTVVVPFSRYYSVSTNSCRSFQQVLFSFY